MEHDLYLISGLFILLLAIPAIVSALRNNAGPPRPAAILLLAGGVLITMALSGKPSGYQLGDIPAAAKRVVNYLLH